MLAAIEESNARGYQGKLVLHAKNEKLFEFYKKLGGKLKENNKFIFNEKVTKALSSWAETGADLRDPIIRKLIKQGRGPIKGGSGAFDRPPRPRYTGPKEGFSNTSLEYDKRLRAMQEIDTTGLDLDEMGRLVNERAARMGPSDPFGDIDYAPTLDEILKDPTKIDFSNPYMYVIDKGGNIRVSTRAAMRQQGIPDHHSFLVKGENVYGAGNIRFRNRNGRLVVEVDAESGHYSRGRRADTSQFGGKFQDYLEYLLKEKGLEVQQWGLGFSPKRSIRR
jgi:hypothetical protein